MKTVGEKISELRKSKGMTQEELATTIGVFHSYSNCQFVVYISSAA